MSTPRRRGIAVLTAAVALAAGTLVAVLPAAADSTEWIDAGELTISTSANTVTFGDAAQPMGSEGCNLAPTAGGLLEFTGFVGTTKKPVGYKSGSIGVNEKVTALCNLVDPATTEGGGIETLELTLGDDLVNFANRPLLASQAELDVRVGVNAWPYIWRRNATVEARFYVGDTATQVGGTYTLIQGSGTSSGNTTYCGVTYGGTCAWDIAPPGRFDTVRLTAVAGAFGLVGESTLALESEVDKALDCDDPTLTQGNARVEYLGNADGSACGQFGVTLAASDDEVRFLKPLDIDPTAQFIFDVDWTQESEGPAATVPTVTIDFENPTGVTIDDMPFCPEILYSAGGDLVGVQDPADISSLPDWRADLAGTQYACLDDPRSVSIGADTVTVTDKVFLIGDARMRLG